MSKTIYWVDQAGSHRGIWHLGHVSYLPVPLHQNYISSGLLLQVGTLLWVWCPTIEMPYYEQCKEYILTMSPRDDLMMFSMDAS